ncbi:alpha/beta hydrolase, partial [Paraglaciecola sp.]|uniref:alpha/beta hydrolase n=1 Tax=Paraglaciecola sp. TaxID=1920173 RepID=UPI0030F48445
MYKKYFSFIVVLSLLGCTAHIRENSFIAQDKDVTNYQALDLKNWQSLFVNHTLQEIDLVSQADEVELKGILLDSPHSQEVIFYIPGNGMKVTNGGIEALKRLAKLDKDIVIFDRRGLGASSGKATIANLIDDSVEEFQFIKNNLKAKSIIVHGYSLGSFVAAQLAKNQPVDALVLQGTATNVDDWIDKKTPWYTKPFLTVEIDEAFKTVDNKVVVSEFYTGPLLIIGGENDEQVPVKLSTSLFNASKSFNKKLMIVANADHGSMLDAP